MRLKVNKNLWRGIRQPVFSRLSLHVPSITKKRGKRRQAKRFYLNLSPKSRLTFVVRNFNTNKSKRSKTRKQLVIPIYFLPVKEIAITKDRRRVSKQQLSMRLGYRLAAAALVIFGLSGSLYFGVNLSRPIKIEPVAVHAQQPVAAKPVGPKKPLTMPSAEPTSLRVLRLSMNVSLVPVGLKGDGSLVIPETFGVAGWYSLSPTPGELGPSVIAGHVDSLKGPSTFWRLREIVPGDIIEIDRADSSTAKFQVDEVKQYPQDAFSNQDVYGSVSYAGLRVITCSGVFNPQTRHYSHNTVIFGSLVKP